MFTLLQPDPNSAARLGRLTLAHGVVETPCFMAVGTQGTVKCMTPDEMRALGAQIILSNTYHLNLRPGIEVIRAAGGLHRFMGWDRPILTDSGGYQVFSLAKLRKLTDDGVEFQSHIDGARCFLGPREVMEIQHVLGSDIAMVLDECPHYPCDRETACKAVERSLTWAARCREEAARIGLSGKLFGIAQGSVYDDLRRLCAERLLPMGFDGYAIGGLSVGEPDEELFRVVEATAAVLPRNQPRYAMGLGTPRQIVELVARGVDMFDCALPTRVGRNGTAFTRRGTQSARVAAWKDDPRPVEEGCACYCCRHYSRAYVRHLFNAGEILGLRLLTWHNLHVYLQLMRDVRAAIAAGTFADFRHEFVTNYRVNNPEGKQIDV
ncbi:MAG: tRNA guanosine(34) transglycosylase Tgt [Verrucomicrobiae bacterium]|nr:tRNA guanosine(34) transglycosylase Tgt [Verrucomicrobiae bacterium]